MNKARLQELANLLRKVPQDKFDLHNWRGTAKIYCGASELTDAHLQDEACGTSGCAVGWACAHKPFQDQGLKWDGTPSFGTFRAWCATRQFFDLNPEGSHHLFDSVHYVGKPTPAQVADRIEDYIRRNA